MANVTSRTITGIAMILVGVGLILAGFFTPVTLIYGIPILIVGLIIFFNKKEDKIEEIKSRRKK